MSHTCHARGCAVPTKPEMLMCYRHWCRVPTAIQREVYATYRAGQCDDRRPSEAWHDAAAAAIGYVALLEKQPLVRSEVRALIARGYEQKIAKAYTEKMGEKMRAAILKVLAEESAKVKEKKVQA